MDNKNLSYLISNISPNINIINFEIVLWHKYLLKKSNTPTQHDLRGNAITHPKLCWEILFNDSLPNKSYNNEDNSIEIYYYNESSENWIKKIVDYFNETSVQESTELSKVTFKEYDEAINIKIQTALEILSNSAKDFKILVEKMIRTITICQGGDFYGASIAHVLGFVLIDSGINWTIPLLIDTLVHEASHIELFIRQLVDPLVVRGQQYLKSPFRKLKRPQSAVLHSAFVLCRVCEVLEKIINDKSVEKLYREQTESLLKSNQKLLKEALYSLKEGAIFSEHGKILFLEMSKRGDK